MSSSVAQDQIRAFVDRILRLKEEAASIKGDIREVYAEAKANGFDKTVLGKVVGYVEKRAAGAADLAEAEALFDLYLSAYDGASVSHTHAYTREREIADALGITEIMRHGVNGPAEREVPVTAAAAGASPAPTSIAAAQAANANEGVDDVAPPPAHAPEQPGTDHGSVNVPAEGSADSAAIIEPVTDPTAASSPAEVTEAGDDRSANPPPKADTVVAFRTHNPETHFLNSKGLQRLHGCLNPDVCAGSRSKLCFTCSVQHEGPAYSDGAA